MASTFSKTVDEVIARAQGAYLIHCAPNVIHRIILIEGLLPRMARGGEPIIWLTTMPYLLAVVDEVARVHGVDKVDVWAVKVKPPTVVKVTSKTLASEEPINRENLLFLGTITLRG